MRSPCRRRLRPLCSGDFTDTKFEHFGVTTTFSRLGDKFVARTDGPDGALADFEIHYTFGVYPLQQYLIEFAGRPHAGAAIAWDARPKSAGGQRWFILIPTSRAARRRAALDAGRPELELLLRGMPLDGPPQELRRRHALATTRPGPRSTSPARPATVPGPATSPGPGTRTAAPDKGFEVAAGERRGGVDASIRRPATPAQHAASDRERNRSLRTLPLAPRAPFEDRAGLFAVRAHLPSLLTSDLYQADGQIHDEVYEYGSFTPEQHVPRGRHVQRLPRSASPHIAGVRQRRLPAVPCRREIPAAAAPLPRAGVAAAACISCHMPTRTYMVVHVRHDHSLRMPRPDRSVCSSARPMRATAATR